MVTVRGLKETASGSIVYETISASNLQTATDKGGQVLIKGIATIAGDIPFRAWEDGLEGDEYLQRIKIGNFTINGISISEPKENTTVELGSVVLQNADLPVSVDYETTSVEGPVPEMGKFDLFAMNQLSVNAKDISFDMGSAVAKGVIFPTRIGQNYFYQSMQQISMYVGDISGKMQGKEVFRLDNYGGSASKGASPNDFTFSGQAKGLFVDLTAIPDRKFQAMREQTGYAALEGDLSSTGSYNLKTGELVNDPITINLKDMLNLSLAFKISGYTEEFAQKVTIAQQQMNKGTPFAQAFGPIFPDLDQLKLEDFNLKIEDKSLTARLLDMQAKQMGTTGDQLALGAPMMIGMGMSRLGMPAFTEMVTNAVGSFLKDQGSITVSAKPAEPVSALKIMTASQTTPQSLPDILNFKVTASK